MVVRGSARPPTTSNLDDLGESPTPEADRGRRTAFPIVGAGFAVDLPETWQTRSSGDPRVVTISGPEGGLKVRVSDENREIVTCRGLARCQPVAASTIAELIAVVRGEYRVRWAITMSPTISQARVTLDGAEATRVTVSPPAGMTGPGTSRYVFVLRDGRDIILEWTPTFLGAGLWNEILASFRFLDDGTVSNPTDEPETGAASSADPLVPFKTFTFPDAGFAIDAPATWHSWSPDVGSFGEISLTGPGMAIAIRLPVDDAGKIWFVLPTGMAHAIPVDSVQDVVAHLVDEYRMRTLLDPSRIRVEQTQTMLGGATATLVVIGPDGNAVSGPAAETYVVALHGGEPIILRSYGTRDKAELFREIVATFRFLD